MKIKYCNIVKLERYLKKKDKIKISLNRVFIKINKENGNSK